MVWAIVWNNDGALYRFVGMCFRVFGVNKVLVNRWLCVNLLRVVGEADAPGVRPYARGKHCGSAKPNLKTSFSFVSALALHYFG